MLVIEDNDTNRALMTYLLGAFGYLTIEAVDGVAGVEKARTTRPHLIICDVHLPALDGYAVVKRLKESESTRHIPIVAVTALAMVGDRDRILAAGFDGYISKPISPETLVSEVEKFLPASLRTKVNPAKAEPVRAFAASSMSLPAGKTILVIDDVPANIEFARSVLEPNGYEVLTARSVEQALKILSCRRPDLVLSDLHMHPESGYDLLMRSRTADPLTAVPIVIVSSTASGDSDEKECLRRGAIAFIRRPVEPELLISKIGAVLGGPRAATDAP